MILLLHINIVSPMILFLLLYCYYYMFKILKAFFPVSNGEIHPRFRKIKVKSFSLHFACKLFQVQTPNQAAVFESLVEGIQLTCYYLTYLRKVTAAKYLKAHFKVPLILLLVLFFYFLGRQTLYRLAMKALEFFFWTTQLLIDLSKQCLVFLFT